MKSWTLDDVARHWDNVPDYDKINAGIDSYMRRFHDSASLFTIPDNARVLDVDCRTGNGTVFFSSMYPSASFRCYAMAPTFVERAQKNFTAKNINAPVSLLKDIPIPEQDESFDIVLSYETLEHTPWPEKFIAELSRVLRPGGTLVLTTPSVLWEPVHWLSATLHLDHGEGPHRMVPRREILEAFTKANLEVHTERSFVLVPAGPKWLLEFGKFLERIAPEWFLRIFALRRTFICSKTPDVWWHKIRTEIVETRLDTHCGTSVGLSDGTLAYEERDGIPVMIRTKKEGVVPRIAYDASPARRCNYPELNTSVFGKVPDNFLSGIVRKAYIAHASDESIRRTGASGGVITMSLIHLLEEGHINGAVCLRMGKDVPYKAAPVVARSREEIIACAQSVYSLTPVNTILSELEEVEGPLAYVGLPDQVAGIRKLQQLNHPSVKQITYVIGPYTGTQMYFESIRSFLRSNGVQSEEEIVDLKYRAGEWPGHLRIELKDGRVLQAEKFYYNYLIPFFITSGSLQLVDFTNELTDISVGDAWSPKFENKGQGYSVVLTRSEKGEGLLRSMEEKGLVHLDEISLDEALDMHGHMLDFKKRGSFIRNSWKPVAPDYGYEPIEIPPSRIAVEWCLRLFFGIGKTRVARWTVEHVPLSVVGPTFNWMRKSWKNISKPTKRKGLRQCKFCLTN